VKGLSVGHPEQNADITAVINKQSADFIQALVDDARAKGGARDLRRHASYLTHRSCLLPRVETPRKLDLSYVDRPVRVVKHIQRCRFQQLRGCRVTEDMRLCFEEPFGPVLPFLRVPNVRCAVEVANKVPFGLQVS
jgi:glyceraldehyde-3-phosphate dehydrogenase (NADP+)